MALFAGLRAEPVPTDMAAAAYHHAVLLRELRGCAHLVAVTAVGLPTVVAHAIKRPDAMSMFGWDEGAPKPTEDDRSRLAEAEYITDRVLAPAFAALSDVQLSALVAGTRAMHAAIVG
jgi:nitroreductase